MRIIVSILLTLMLWESAQAQEPPDLTVTLRNTVGNGVVATVSVRDESGRHELARTETDASGTATFPHLQESVVRVSVTGTADGIRLYQEGSDVEGILLRLSAPPTRLDLRMDTDGLVLPDPETMIAPDQHAQAYPTALFATTTPVATIGLSPSPLSLPSVAVPTVVPATIAVPTPDKDVVDSSMSPLYLLLSIGLGLGIVVGVVWFSRRRRGV